MSRITFGGLASGLDTNLMIEQLVQLEREPIVRKEKRIEELDRVRDTWRDINMRLRHLRGTLEGLLDRDNFQSMRGESTDPSMVTAQAGSGATPATYELHVHQLATNHTVTMNTDVQTLLDKGVNDALGIDGVFQIKNLSPEGEEYVEIQVQATDSLSTLKNKINTAHAGVTASIIAGHLVLESNETGAENELEMAHVSGQDVLGALQIVDPDTSTFYRETLAAQDSHFTINGVSAMRSSNMVDDVIDDVTFSFNNVTTTPVHVQIGADTERAVETLAAFVEQYNSVNEFIREKLAKREEGETGSRGMLQGDTTLMKIERTLRTLVNSPVSNARYQDEDGNWQQKEYSSLASLGVMTFDKEGFLQFNENRLMVALQDDPEAVFEVMKFKVADGEEFGVDEHSGVAVELDNYLRRLLMTEQASDGSILRPISVQQEASIQRRIDEINRRIDIREERLLRYEERLIRQFTSLEKYIASMQSQGQELQNMINQMTGFGSGNRN